jgi:hypothetical protein
MRRISAWAAANIEEIAQDPALRIYGALLAVTHALSFLVWRQVGVARMLASTEALCWPFWEDCQKFRVFSAEQIQTFLWVYLGLALCSAALFLKSRWTGKAWGLLLLLTFLKFFILAQDFLLRLNQHYMIAFASLPFLFFPRKRDLLRLIVVFFYFWAGVLKLDPEWLTGAALYTRPWLIPDKLLPIACGYVVFLEMVLVWGIFSRKTWLFWMTFGQLVLFHIFSFKIVGFFYPAVMFCLIAIYPLARIFPVPAPVVSNPLGDLLKGSASVSAYVLLAFFSVLQILPAFYPGDSALTGEGRWLALHMFDAKVECEAYAVLKKPDGESKRADLRLNLPRRIRCDPLVYFDRARYLCSLRRPDQGFSDFDLFLNSRRSTEAQLQPVIQLENFCATDPHYDLWRHNAWIRTP